MRLKLCFGVFPHQSSLRCFLPKNNWVTYAKRTSINIYLVWDSERANSILNTLIWMWQSKNLHFHRFSFLLIWGNKDKKQTGGQHRENKNVNENDSWGGYSDKKKSVKWCYLLVVRYLQSLVDLVVVLIKQGMSK